MSMFSKALKAFSIGVVEGLVEGVLTGDVDSEKKEQLDKLSNGQDTIFIDGKEYTRYEAEIKQSRGELYNPSYW
ncbi:hypothetical protein [Shewanella xiamenensis]|uniref:hypothetical protein n=1 Tax=Shewanella xiamenensis TaxID=332186 RepID=UPI0021C07C0C|nr:hypothetical protein [Shewanella xiamenensis]MCT8873752.1 hypothetical protein [Shewanella xiamenensis]